MDVGEEEGRSRGEIEKAARRYFFRLAREFPTLCLQDEFFFFPRVSEARHEFERAAQLSEAVIEEVVSEVSGLLTTLGRLPLERLDQETAADLVVLQQSMRGLLHQLGRAAVWRRDPLFYLKAASLSLAPVLARSPLITWQDEERLAELFVNIGRILFWGSRQVKRLTPPLRELFQGAVEDTARFFAGEVRRFLEAHFPGSSWWPARLGDILRGLAAFRDQVGQRPVEGEFRLGSEGLQLLLAETFGVREDLGEMAKILAQEEEEVTRALETVAETISPRASWGQILDGYLPPRGAGLKALPLYRQEVRRLRDFWGKNPVLPKVAGPLKVVPTPIYLRSLRATASYSAPWICQPGIPGHFYISPVAQESAHRWRQHRFLSAHETYPGHHYLDLQRLSHPSMVRRGYESPVYYEGWACYGETLLVEQGYVVEPREVLVGYQRRLWRALRGRVDLELHTGEVDLEGAVKVLERANYPFAARQACRWAVNPGYQLCYTLGLRQILGLRELFEPGLGLAEFHRVLLSGGQLSFGWLEKRLQEAAGSK